jgi:hypothetical protein
LFSFEDGPVNSVFEFLTDQPNSWGNFVDGIIYVSGYSNDENNRDFSFALQCMNSEATTELVGPSGFSLALKMTDQAIADLNLFGNPMFVGCATGPRTEEPSIIYSLHFVVYAKVSAWVGRLLEELPERMDFGNSSYEELLPSRTVWTPGAFPLQVYFDVPPVVSQQVMNTFAQTSSEWFRPMGGSWVWERTEDPFLANVKIKANPDVSDGHTLIFEPKGWITKAEVTIGTAAIEEDGFPTQVAREIGKMMGSDTVSPDSADLMFTTFATNTLKLPSVRDRNTIKRIYERPRGS